MENCDSSNNNEYCVSTNENCIVRPNYKPQHTRPVIDTFTVPLVVKHISQKEIEFWNQPATFAPIPKRPTPLPWWKWSDFSP